MPLFSSVWGERGAWRAGQGAKRESPRACGVGGFLTIFGNGLLSRKKICSIIGDGELNCRVRDGIGCTLSSMVTKEILLCLLHFAGGRRRGFSGHGRGSPLPAQVAWLSCQNATSAPNTETRREGQEKAGSQKTYTLRLSKYVIDREGRSCNQKQASRAISTGQLHASRRFHLRPINEVVSLGPSGIAPGKTYLKAGFPLRCFQRLSLPHIATLLCRWHDNRSTRGASIPVLSY